MNFLCDACAILLAVTSSTAVAGEPAAEGDVIADDGLGTEVFSDPALRHGRLTETDYIQVARENGLEVATIKAVVEVEAGAAGKGFWSEGKPLINFDLAIFRRFAARRGINLNRYKTGHAAVFERPDIKKHGEQQAAVQARLDAARTIDDGLAIESTFWGMFQIGGFNWQKCGAADIDEFVRLMSRSERDQLEMFVRFITNTGMIGHLKNKNWSAFAAMYNGPGYRARGYHTKLAKAYAKHVN